MNFYICSVHLENTFWMLVYYINIIIIIIINYYLHKLKQKENLQRAQHRKI